MNFHETSLGGIKAELIDFIMGFRPKVGLIFSLSRKIYWWQMSEWRRRLSRLWRFHHTVNQDIGDVYMGE